MMNYFDTFDKCFYSLKNMDTVQGKILAIDDNKEILLSLRVALNKYFEEIVTSDKYDSKIEKEIIQGAFDVILLDMNFAPGVTTGREGLRILNKIVELDSSVAVVMITAYGDIDLAIQAIKSGAFDFVVKPWDNKKLIATVTAAFKLSKSKRETEKLKFRKKILENEIEQQYSLLLGESEAMKSIQATIEKIAHTDANVLILGENGTGKELVARAIHKLSKRSEQVFVSVDLGAIPESLFESELFGHVKGAFTDARENKPGRFEIASGGTLFFDEISNIPLNLQAKLLGALQTRNITPLGSSVSKNVDIRLICATNENILQNIATGKFRQDLFYRINTIEITLPPLRERDDDIFLIANHYLSVFGKKYNKRNLRLSKRTKELMLSYQWPGNVRELTHAIERAVIMTDSSLIEPESIIINQPKDNADFYSSSLNKEEVEKQTIIKALALNKGNISMAARALGMGRATLYRKIEKYGI